MEFIRSVEIEARPNVSAIPSDESQTGQCESDPLNLSSLQDEVRHLLEQNARDHEFGSNLITFNNSCAVANENSGVSVDDVAVAVAITSKDISLEEQESQHALDLPLRGANRDWSSEKTQHSPRNILHLSVDGPKSDTFSVQDAGSDELERLSTNTSEIHDGWSSETDLEIYAENSEAPTVFPWKELPIDESDIRPRTLKPSTSVVTDLGDRGFYANLNATGRKSVAWLDLEDDYEDLALQDQFFETLVRVHQEKKGFFPRAMLATMVTERCVFDELSRLLGNEYKETQIREYARKVCEEIHLPTSEDDNRPPRTRSFKKIFVILVMIEKTASISKFLEEDVNDLNIPLVKHDKGKNGTRFDLRISGMEGKKLESFKNWTQSQIQAFEDWQWTTVAPFFHKGSCKDVQHFRLAGSVMLPYTMDGRRGNESESRSEIAGGFGRVFKVVIHPDHHNFNLPENQCFAVKRLNSLKVADFRHEVEMLKMFSDNVHPHLISLLATYEQFGVYHLIFPWADGDLNNYWSESNPNPSVNATTILWVARQCKGISSGLLKIHRYTSNLKNQTLSHEKRYGRHGDLTPRNILWFSEDNGEGGTLKICDFGLSDFSTVHSKSYKAKTLVATSMSYRPPESDLKGGRIGQSSDIWTLGCLYLEFITWLLGGYKLVKEFARKRASFDRKWSDMYTDTFFTLLENPQYKGAGSTQAMIKPAVTKFVVESLHAHHNCTEFLHDFINMIQFDMLIIKPNDLSEKGRISGEQVHAKLAAMLGKCNDLEYLCKPAPWTYSCLISYEVEKVGQAEFSGSVAEFLQRKKSLHFRAPVQVTPRSEHLEIPETVRSTIGEGVWESRIVAHILFGSSRIVGIDSRDAAYK